MRFPIIELIVVTVVSSASACAHDDRGAQSPSDQPANGTSDGMGATGGANNMSTGGSGGTTDMGTGGTTATGGTMATGGTTTTGGTGNGGTGTTSQNSAAPSTWG